MRTLPALLLAAAPAAYAADHDCGPTCTHGHHHASDDSDASWFDRANDWSLWDGLISGSLHGYMSYGGSTGELGELQTGGHDPQREGWTLQAIEPSISIKPTEHISGFANGLFFSDAEGDVSWEWEEIFGSVHDLPGGFDLRGGQFLNRVGVFNPTHIHQWQFVDMPLLTTRFLGDDGLITRSGEINWRPQIGDPLTNQSILTVSYGEVRPHNHDHSHGDHNHHGHDHDHDEVEALFEEEGAHFNDRVFSTRAAHSHRFSDQHELTTGISYVYGDNEFGRHNHVGGLDFSYRWNADLTDPDAVSVLWKTEIFGRSVAARSGEIHGDEEHHDHHEDEEHHEDDHHEEDHLAHEDHDEDEHHDDGPRDATFDEIGISSSVVASWSRHWDTGIRFDYVSGIQDLGLNERIRVSPSVTFFPDNNRRTHIRAQYNFDHSPNHGSDHTVWIQAGIALGSPH
ncbi:hypothetical protein [Sulfuriroseicoccus oceanibius]|uniref:Zinc-regulated TonB-dependent outer membrane receptor n=1 Tax=Sulfuriroseicoccus oceanibius TaxID=2707525 RepID=A0A6B3LBE2_9BACT|nr:hypothetical protein [Sulfuriroseicoccus oceanibius]QQL45653.1 hypothetical protein G3M56_003420 [Sulfuriroseicoccus oceanibius]